MRLGAMDETAIGILVDSIAREWDHSSEAYSSSYWTVRPATAKSRACKPPVIGANLYHSSVVRVIDFDAVIKSWKSSYGN